MSLESRLAELERRHVDLDKQIEEALAHPSVDPLEVTKLKRRKLFLKDEIMRVKSETAH